MENIKMGERVRISTFRHSCYHGKTGTVKTILTDDPDLENVPGFELSHTYHPGMVRVTLDQAVDVGDGMMVWEDLFLPRELIRLSPDGKEG